MIKKLFPLILVLFFAFVAGLPLLHKGLPPTHDGEYHVVRFYEFDKTLRDGNWYPRWAADFNNGYGVPLFNYVYPLPNYVASFLHLLGFSFIDSFKLNMFFATILGAVFFYLWAKEFWGYWGGMVGAIFYTYSPYHFLDIYIRGSVGEVWALAFFPAFLWSITNFINNQKTIFFVGSSIFLSLIIFSHNILALMFFSFALSYTGVLIYKKANKKHLILYTCYIILLGLGLSAIFWLPALFERQYVRGLEIFDVVRHFPDLYQLIIPSWGSGFSGESMGDQMSFQIGIANLTVVLLSLLSVIFIFIFRHSGKRSASRISSDSERFWTSQNDGKMSISFFFLVLFFVIFFLMLKISLPIWKSVPFMNYFQFPWRLLSLEILVASFLSGSIVYFWRSKIVAIFLVLIAFFLGIGYTKPAYYHYREDNYYLTKSNFIDGTNSPGNVFNTIFFKNVKDKEKDKITFINGTGDVRVREVKAESYLFKITADSPSKIQINTAYFPGWSVFVDGKPTKTDITNEGLFSFYLAYGSHEVEIRLVNTTIRNLAVLCFFISGASLMVLFIKALFATIKR